MASEPNNETEERYPLLFLYLEDAKSGSKGYRKMFSSKNNRSSDISSGATAVITQWPGHLASCWLASLLCGLALLVLTMLLLAATSRQDAHLLNPRCIGVHVFEDKRLDNETLHLVHESELWSQLQVETLDEIVRNFRNSKVHLVLIVNGNVTTTTTSDAEVSSGDFTTEDVKNSSTTGLKKRNKRGLPAIHNNRKYKRQKKWKHVTTKRTKRAKDFDINIGNKNLLMVLLKNRKQHSKPMTTTTSNELTTTECSHQANISDLLKKHPQVLVDVLSYEEVFANSPLRDTWTNLSPESRLFATRVLFLWQFGGISYALPSSDANETDAKKDNVGKLIAAGYTGFKSLPRGIVTIDDQGLHMQTKTTCHAFFGEILTKMKGSSEGTSVEEIIKDTLKVFCKRGAVDSGYCANINKG